MVLITERLDVKTGDRILEKIEVTHEASVLARQALAESQEVIKSFTDSVEPTQESMQAAQVAIREAQTTIKNFVDTLEPTQAILKAKMDESLLPLTGEEIPEQDNPITLMELPQLIYLNESEHPFQFGGGTIKRESGSWSNGEEVIVLVQTKESGGWATIWDEKYSEPVDFEKKKLPVIYNDGSGLRISIRQKTEGDGYHIWSYSFVSAERTV